MNLFEVRGAAAERARDLNASMRGVRIAVYLSNTIAESFLAIRHRTSGDTPPDPNVRTNCTAVYQYAIRCNWTICNYVG